ncbi:MAG: hypothetical protein IIB00_02440, partial [candidate division Zixibacteria bacterium]|nr:hypothetical protein [candidate division Zixibacteria bacterium]
EGAALIEKACLTCHEPDPDGSNFARLDFEKHCADCHLTGGMESAALNVDGKNGDKAGVETLEMIRKRMGPRARWAYYMNPNEFETKAGGRKVVKSPLHHADPWILENLNVLRRQLYPELELAELTKASGEVGLANVNDVHSEALEKLQAYSDELKSRPEEELAIEIKTIDSLIRKLRREIELESFTSSPRLTEKSFFDPTSATLDPSLSPEKIDELKGLVVALTGKDNKLCQQCHTVQYASVMRVSAEQEILNRVEFNHRAHILESGCLDCHTDIPVTSEMSAGKTVDSTLDRAAVQNIPGIKNCRSCHTSSGASTNCVSCHLFHPNKNNRGSLQLFVGAR